MKNFLRAIFVLSFAFTFSIGNLLADTIAPVVSIGSGNGNIPENTGPASGTVFDGSLPIFVTVTDTDLDNYHFRVVKDGMLDGHTCTVEGSLFLAENQGYASTTQGKLACGYVFNQSVYVAPVGFANTQIATLNAKDLIAFAGEGDYWLIIGAVDALGNRTNSNYLNDAKIKVKAVNQVPSAPVPPQTPVVSGGGGGNGPIANSYGVVSSGQTFAPTQTTVIPASAVTNPGVVISNSQATGDVALLADGGIPTNEIIDVNGDAGMNDVEGVDNETNSTNSEQTAQAVSSGFNLNWLWLVLAIVLAGGGYYYFTKKN